MSRFQILHFIDVCEQETFRQTTDMVKFVRVIGYVWFMTWLHRVGSSSFSKSNTTEHFPGDLRIISNSVCGDKTFLTGIWAPVVAKTWCLPLHNQSRWALSQEKHWRFKREKKWNIKSQHEEISLDLTVVLQKHTLPTSIVVIGSFTHGSKLCLHPEEMSEFLSPL